MPLYFFFRKDENITHKSFNLIYVVVFIYTDVSASHLIAKYRNAHCNFCQKKVHKKYDYKTAISAIIKSAQTRRFTSSQGLEIC